MGHFAQCLSVITIVPQAINKFGHTGSVTEFHGYDGPVKIRAQGHVLDADALGDIVNVTHDLGYGRCGLQKTVLPQETDMKIDPDDAAGLANGIQLLID